jgi:hypothetical protein
MVHTGKPLNAHMANQKLALVPSWALSRGGQSIVIMDHAGGLTKRSYGRLESTKRANCRYRCFKQASRSVPFSEMIGWSRIAASGASIFFMLCVTIRPARAMSAIVARARRGPVSIGCIVLLLPSRAFLVVGPSTSVLPQTLLQWPLPR